jgi:hypothetical protein
MPGFPIRAPLVGPHQRRAPIEPADLDQRHAMLGDVGCVLVGVVLDPHEIYCDGNK